MKRERERMVWSCEDARGNRATLIVRGELDAEKLDVIQEWIDWRRKQRPNVQE